MCSGLFNYQSFSISEFLSWLELHRQVKLAKKLAILIIPSCKKSVFKKNVALVLTPKDLNSSEGERYKTKVVGVGSSCCFISFFFDEI